MHTTPRTKGDKFRQSLGEPSRVPQFHSRERAGTRDFSPGAASVDSQGSFENVSTRSRRTPGAFRAGNSTGQRTRVAGRAGAHQRDPRPLQDKTFTANCVRNIVQYLQGHGFGRTVSHRSLLQSPSTREFQDIFKFLISHIDPHLELEGKLEDEVPPMMKRLKYPVEVNKSKLQAVGAPNTWPQLLAVLDWLVGLIQYDEDVIKPTALCAPSVDGVDAEEGEHQFLRSLHENYHQYLVGNDDNSHEERLKQHFEDRISALGEDTRRIEEQSLACRSRLDEQKARQEYFNELRGGPKVHYADAERERGLLESQDIRQHAAENRKAELETYESDQDRVSEGLEAAVQQLTEQVEVQACSKKDIERLKHERQHHKSVLNQVRGEVEEAEQGVWELGMEESRLTEALSSGARGANEAVEQVVHALPKARGSELMVRIDLYEPNDGLESLEWSCAQAHAEETAAREVDEAQAEEAALCGVLEEQRLNQEQLSHVDREIRRLNVRREQLVRMRLEHQSQSSAVLEEAQGAAEEAEDAIHAIPATAAPSIRDEAEVDRLRRQIETMEKTFAEEEQALDEQVRQDDEKFAEYRCFVLQELGGVVKEMERLRSEVEASEPLVPSEPGRGNPKAWDGSLGGC